MAPELLRGLGRKHVLVDQLVDPLLVLELLLAHHQQPDKTQSTPTLRQGESVFLCVCENGHVCRHVYVCANLCVFVGQGVCLCMCMCVSVCVCVVCICVCMGRGRWMHVHVLVAVCIFHCMKENISICPVHFLQLFLHQKFRPALSNAVCPKAVHYTNTDQHKGPGLSIETLVK